MTLTVSQAKRYQANINSILGRLNRVLLEAHQAGMVLELLVEGTEMKGEVRIPDGDNQWQSLN